jgi:hypothetical protein
VKAVCKGSRFELSEDALERIMRRDAIGQRQKLLQPVVPVFAELGHLLPFVTATDYGTNSDGDDIQQAVPTAAGHAWLLKIGEMSRD